MDDDATIRDELRGLADRRPGTPTGHLTVSLTDLAASAIDTDDAARWVEAHGGYVDRRISYGFAHLVIPRAALRD
jgi:hypothetical protein